MKVLHLIGGGDVGGAKIHVLSLVKELSKYIDVKIISFRHGIFYEEATALGIDIEVVKTGTIFSDIIKVVKLINSGYDVVHSHGSKANMVSALARPFISSPTISTIHSDYKLDYLNNFWKSITFGKINSIALRFINYYIAVSHNFYDMLINRKFDRSSIFHIANGMNFDQSSVKQYSKQHFLNKYNLEYLKDSFIIGILARLHPVKDVSTFLKAAKEVLRSNPEVKFLIGGDGEEEDALKLKVQEYGIQNSVHFLGFIHEDPYEFMHAIDINVLTSLSESLPYTILEGACFKKATISSDVGGISELIKHNKNGLLFRAGDHRGLASHILKLVNNKTLCFELGQNLYQETKKKFSLKTMCSMQLGIYNKILIAQKNAHSQQLKKSKQYDFLISGYYGSGNIGDDALLSAIINDIKRLKPEAKIAVLSRDPKETIKIYNIDSINRLHLHKILLAMKNSKIFINGGGSLIQDIKSSRSLFYYLSTILFAKILGLKVILYANGIGPINKTINKKLTQMVLNSTDLITLRDSNSKNELNELKISKPLIEITADPALAIEGLNGENITTILINEGIPLNSKYIGFSIRRWNDIETYQDIIADIADYVINTYQLIPIFLPMHFPDDFIISTAIMNKVKGQCYSLTKKYTASELIGIINKLDLLIGMRLHALIFAASVSTPIIGIEYEHKVRSFLNYMDLEDTCYAGYINSLDKSNLIKIIDSIMADKTKYIDILTKNVSKLKIKAVDNARLAINELELTELNNFEFPSKKRVKL